MHSKAQTPVMGLLLAAGHGRRFGSDKRWAPLADGTPVAVAACRNLLTGAGRALAVVRAGDEELARRLRAEGAETTAFAGAASGLGASLAFGVQASQGAAGWVVALADMPWIAPGTIRQVAAAVAAGAELAVPFHGGRRGHPVGFGHVHGPALMALAGDAGARHFLDAAGASLWRLDVEDAGILCDIDRPGDLARAWP